jgi:hypothetical protein
LATMKGHFFTWDWYRLSQTGRETA